jgi:hypothetical protein
MTPEQRIADLERENATLRSRLRHAGLMPPPADLPSDSECDQLLTLVEQRHPILAVPNDSQHKRAFLNAIHYLTFAHRVPEFSKYAATVFLDEANGWLNRFTIPGGTTLKAFTAAAIVMRFIYADLGQFPYGLEFGIALGSSGRPIAGWRNTLAEGRVPSPTESKRRAPAQPQVAQLNLAPSLRGR